MATKAKREKLTDNQDKFVRANCGRMCIQEMATAQRVPYSRIYAHMKSNDIPVKEFRTNKVKVIDITAPGCFNSKDMKNWLF
jgi:hypothetical protein